jgi:hypothetical protein
MSTSHPPPGVTPESKSAGYELSRVSVKGTFHFILWFAVTIAVILTVLWYAGPWVRRGPAFNMTQLLPPTAVPPLQPSPEDPNLPWQDLEKQRHEQEAHLHSSGPLAGDPQHRHIPIDQAMDDLLRSGVLQQPWQNPTTLPYQRPPSEQDRGLPKVENRT